MTNSTRLIGLVMTAALWAGVAAAQGMTGAGDDLPPDLTLPSQGAQSFPAPAGQSTDAQTASPYDATQSPVSSDGYDESENCDSYLPKDRGLWTELAPIESTGTWLRRGFWYAEADAVIYNRLWSRKDKRFAAEDANVVDGPVPGTSLGFNPIFLDTNRILILNGGLPGQDASARGTLGNFLFRDDHNRDHTVEFTAQGGGTWEQERTMSSVAPHGLFVPFFIAGHNVTFNSATVGSTSQSIDYASDLSTFELNYRVRGRLGHDQLIMDANGDWHRAADAGFEREYLVGLRFLSLGERFNWTAQDIVNVGDDGNYRIRTQNNLFGYQMGTGVTYQAPRWSLGTNVKGGVFLNRATGTSRLDFTANDTNDFDLDMVENQLSFVGEFRLQAKYHLLPNVSLRAAWEMMLITSAALAPTQTTFTSDTTYLNTTGNPFYQGASFGCDFYW
jgi:Putative beta barrel porin-7 (BBP7)